MFVSRFALAWTTALPPLRRPPNNPTLSSFLTPLRHRPLPSSSPTHRTTTTASASTSPPPTPSPSPYLQRETIFALSSGASASSGVAIIRISGTNALAAAASLFPGALPAPRTVGLRCLRHPDTLDLLDHALVLTFPAPASFTGEDVAELHVHGSRAVIAAVSSALLPSARPASRGEFTRRAFENGRLDLTAVEGLADLIAAETDAQRRQALRQLGGDVKAVFDAWRTQVRDCLAHAEAVIDFGDDVDDGVFEAVLPRVADLRDAMAARMADGRRGEIVRDGVRVAIVGAPNAGKSTLLNCLARREAAIVSEEAGTTRDVVEVRMDIGGVAVVLSDTAGIRDGSVGKVEEEGIRRAVEVARTAHVTILVRDASSADAESVVVCNVFEAADEASRLLVLNKVDLVVGNAEQGDSQSTAAAVFCTSFRDGVGVDDLMTGLEALVKEKVGGGVGGGDTAADDAEIPIITRTRHRYHVERTVEALDTFLRGRTGENRDRYLPMDLATEELRFASRELGAVTGEIHVEEVLDVIFSSFCIGK